MIIPETIDSLFRQDVRVVPVVSREALSSAQATFNAEMKSIDLSWKKPANPVKYYVIYRGKSGKRPLSLTSVEGNLNRFSDTSMTGKGTYRYMIRAIYADGGESPFLNFQEMEVK
jgi:fibronectin type 3 domain-containing protein